MPFAAKSQTVIQFSWKRCAHINLQKTKEESFPLTPCFSSLYGKTSSVPAAITVEHKSHQYSDDRYHDPYCRITRCASTHNNKGLLNKGGCQKLSCAQRPKQAQIISSHCESDTLCLDYQSPYGQFLVHHLMLVKFIIFHWKSHGLSSANTFFHPLVTLPS